MSQPLFGRTAGTGDALSYAQKYGLDFLDLHFRGDEARLLQAVDQLDAAGVRYAPNFEGAPVGWLPSANLRADLARRQGFLGFLFDELDHMQINAHWPVIDYYGYDDAHYLAETENLNLFEARQAVLDILMQRGAACKIGEKAPAGEFLFPVMQHTAARAGFHVAPKILKETCGPAMLAVAVGAARQYSTEFWIDVDYWWHNETLGHSLERFESALKLAYWSGADKIYVEGGGPYSKGHPLAEQIENAYIDFLRSYVPANPRPFTWRDFRPQIGIIRFDDTCFDMRQGLLGEYPGPLYGHVAAGPANTEWLNIWSLLSHGFVRTDSLSHQWESRRFGSRTLFVPLHNVAVYDHQVSAETLAGLRLIFLTGETISSETMEAVGALVRSGATCVLPPRLAPAGSGLGDLRAAARVDDGAGRWLVVPDFYRLHYETFCGGPADPLLRETLAGLTGDGDTLVYDFGSHQVRVRQGGWDYPRHHIMTWTVPLTQAGANPDRLEFQIETTPRAQEAFRPGEVWFDTDGRPVQAHGGGMLFVDGTYYWFGENKDGPNYLDPTRGPLHRVDVIGISCYSSTDLVHWKNEGIVLAAEPSDPNSELHPSKVLERPKVMRNPKTGKYVLFAHVDTADYQYARIGVAVSDTPTGPYQYLGSMQPNGHDSRDMTAFQDDDGTAYLFFSSDWNKTMRIVQLDDDYLRPTEVEAAAFVNQSREAPAVFKRGGVYYLISSGCTGWDPNRAEIASAPHPLGPWTVLGDPCAGPDSEITFFAQSTFVFPVAGRPDAYIAMFDRWKKENLRDSRYVWLPVDFTGGVTIRWRSEWTINDAFGPHS